MKFRELVLINSGLDIDEFAEAINVDTETAICILEQREQLTDDLVQKISSVAILSESTVRDIYTMESAESYFSKALFGFNNEEIKVMRENGCTIQDLVYYTGLMEDDIRKVLGIETIESDNELVEMSSHFGMNIDEISEVTGLDREDVLKEIRLTNKKWASTYNDIEPKEVVDLMDEGMNKTQVAEKLGISISTVTSKLDDFQLKSKEKNNIFFDKEAIYQKFTEIHTMNGVAKLFGCSIITVKKKIVQYCKEHQIDLSQFGISYKEKPKKIKIEDITCERVYNTYVENQYSKYTTGKALKKSSTFVKNGLKRFATKYGVTIPEYETIHETVEVTSQQVYDAVMRLGSKTAAKKELKISLKRLNDLLNKKLSSNF